MIADAIGEHLWKTPEFGLKEKDIIIIHTDRKGDISDKEFEKLREDVRDIDSRSSRVR